MQPPASNQLVFRIEGEGLQPSNTPAHTLAEVIRLVERTILSQQGSCESDEVVSLVSIDPGSTRLRFVVSGALTGAVAAISSATSGSDFSRLSRPAQESLHNIQSLCESNSWSVAVGMTEDEQSLKRLEVPAPTSIEMLSGPTSLYGQCIAVGGVEPKAKIRPANQSRLVHIDIDEELARALGDRLYEDVGLAGDAVWNSESGDLVSFRAAELIPFDDPSPLDAFKQLAELIGQYFIDIDAPAFVDELRGNRNQ